MVIFYYASVVVLSKEFATRRKIFQIQSFASAHIINSINKSILAFIRENSTENKIDLSQEART